MFGCCCCCRSCPCPHQASRGLSFGLRSNPRKKKATYRKKQGADDNYTLARFDPVLLDVLEDAVAGKLNQDEYPYVRCVCCVCCVCGCVCI